jgi:4-amino-4-deoxy-L-arabinose transferase-like glycosyltransferase
MGRLLLLDGLLALWVTLALLAGFEALRGTRVRWTWWLLAAGALGLGVLTKGPVAVLLFVPPLLFHRWLNGAVCLVKLGHLAAFIALSLALVLPWYVAVYVRMPTFFGHFFWQHNVLRFLTPFDHLEPIWYYLPIVLGSLLPGMLLLPGFTRFLLSGQQEVAARRCPELGFFLLAGGWCLFFFTLSGSKLPTYVLPAFPPLALALGYYLCAGGWRQTRWPAAITGASFVILAVANFVLVPWYACYRSPVGRFDDVARYCADSSLPVICYPRNCDSVSFYLGRDDLQGFRSHDIEELRRVLRERNRTVVLCTHRHSLNGLREALPPELRLVDATHFGLEHMPGIPDWLDHRLTRLLGETALGLSDAVIVEHRHP